MARHGRNGQLPDQVRRFIREYLIDLNGTKAAIRAGYSEKTAQVQSSQLLSKPMVREAVNDGLQKIFKSLEMSATEVIAELSNLGRANMEDYVMHENGDITPDLSKCTRAQMAAIQEFTVDTTGGTGDGERKLILRTRFRLADKHRPLETLAKYHKLLTERVEVGASDDLLAALAEGRRRIACQP